MYLQESNSSLGENPYVLFVSFLYAWIAADIAGRFSNVSSRWSEYKRLKPRWWYVPIWSHLTLAGFVVGTSWLGWTNAFKHDVSAPGEVIAPSSLLLIVDFWILAAYFAFVAVVNEARLSDKIQESSRSGQAAYWLALILLAYVLWDVLSYRVLPRWTGRGDGGHFWARSWMSVFCSVLAIASFFVLRRVRPHRPFLTLAADVSLIALVLLYRALKQLASTCEPPGEQIENLARHPIGGWLNGFTWGCFLAFLSLGGSAGLLVHRPRLTRRE
jgi:hypothetical protein